MLANSEPEKERESRHREEEAPEIAAHAPLTVLAAAVVLGLSRSGSGIVVVPGTGPAVLLFEVDPQQQDFWRKTMFDKDRTHQATSPRCHDDAEEKRRS